MPSKYPGGYVIIDLKGANEGDVVPGLYELIEQEVKPVFVTNSGSSLLPDRALPFYGYGTYGVDDIDAYFFGIPYVEWNQGIATLSVYLAVDSNDTIHVLEI